MSTVKNAIAFICEYYGKRFLYLYASPPLFFISELIFAEPTVYLGCVNNYTNPIKLTLCGIASDASDESKTSTQRSCWPIVIGIDFYYLRPQKDNRPC